MAGRSSLCVALLAELVLAGFAAVNASAAESLVRLRIKDGFRLVAPVLINGQGPYDFLLDTGAAHTSVDGPLARKLHLRARSQTQVIAYTGAPAAAVAAVQSIAVGPESVRSMDVLCYDVRKLFSLGEGIRGILGQDFLSRFNYLISYTEKTIQFEKNGELMSLLPGSPLRSKRYEGKFYVYTQTAVEGGHSQRYLLDSGTQYPILFEQPAQEFTVLRNEPSPVMITSAGQRKLRPCVIAVLQFGNVFLKNVRLMLADALPGEQPFENGLLPLSLFKSIYFNNRKGYVVFNPVLSPDQ